MHSASGKKIFPTYFYSLDLLRGAAALAVVFWHWQHFFYIGSSLGPCELEKQPLFDVFGFLYKNGWRAVDLFFCLSGFVFFCLYSKEIENRKISAMKFFLLRISRLYPLHIVTLFLLVFGQHIFKEDFGYYFVFQSNDLYHFILQLFFASNWGFENGFSFNGPVWSVSVEILCYAIFFMVCYLKLNNLWIIIALISLLTYATHQFDGNRVLHGLLCFFMGGISFKLYRFIFLKNTILLSLVIFMVCILFWIFIPFIHDKSFEYYASYTTKISNGDILFPGKSIIGYAVFIILRFSYELILFPSSIVLFALLEAFYHDLFKKFGFFGKISYSSYLLHFPLQLCFILITNFLNLNNMFFYTPFSLFLFFSCLIPLSLFSYIYFEHPLQKKMRELFIK